MVGSTLQVSTFERYVRGTFKRPANSLCESACILRISRTRLPTICATSNLFSIAVVVELTGSGTGQIESSRRFIQNRWHRRQRDFRVRNCTSPQCGQERTSRFSVMVG